MRITKKSPMGSVVPGQGTFSGGWILWAPITCNVTLIMQIEQRRRSILTIMRPENFLFSSHFHYLDPKGNIFCTHLLLWNLFPSHDDSINACKLYFHASLLVIQSSDNWGIQGNHSQHFNPPRTYWQWLTTSASLGVHWPTSEEDSNTDQPSYKCFD